MSENDIDPLRYSRHFAIEEVGQDGQARISGASILLIGAGGLGSPAALYLAAAGVGRLGLVDADRVDLSNLQRQILHDTPSVGEPKVASGGRRLRALNPDIEIAEYETRLESSNALEIFADGWNLVLDGSDNFPTRYLVNDACVLTGIPWVYGAVLRFEGQASVFATPEGPCYRCLFREPPPPGLVPNCAEAGVLGVLPGLIGTIQATEALKWVLGTGDPLAGRLLLVDALRMDFRELSIARDPECPACGDQPAITGLIDYEQFCGLGPAAEEEDMGCPEIDVAELHRRWEAGEEFQLVDIREDYEWDICNLAELGALHLPMGELADRVGEISRDRPVVVHCRSGPRGSQVTSYLQSVGYDNVANLDGGILAWAAAYDPEMTVY